MVFAAGLLLAGLATSYDIEEMSREMSGDMSGDKDDMSEDDEGCEEGWYQGSGNATAGSCYSLTEVEVSYKNAKKSCNEMGAKLAEPSSMEALQQLGQLFGDNGNAM